MLPAGCCWQHWRRVLSQRCGAALCGDVGGARPAAVPSPFEREHREHKRHAALSAHPLPCVTRTWPTLRPTVQGPQQPGGSGGGGGGRPLPRGQGLCASWGAARRGRHPAVGAAGQARGGGDRDAAAGRGAVLQRYVGVGGVCVCARGRGGVGGWLAKRAAGVAGVLPLDEVPSSRGGEGGWTGAAAHTVGPQYSAGRGGQAAQQQHPL